MRLKNLTKSISIIIMLLAMMFSCDQPTDVDSNNSNQQNAIQAFYDKKSSMKKINAYATEHICEQKLLLYF